MTQFFEIVLATLLTIVPPGNTVFSRVPLLICDEKCQETPLCDNPHHWKCKKPTFSPQLYSQYLNYYTSQMMSIEQAQREARIRSFTRPETYEEGLIRYAILAESISEVSKEMTRNICFKEQCSDKNPEEQNTCHKQCAEEAPWRWKRLELAYMIIIATNQESGYRGDVHGGTGRFGRGDCNWRYKDGKLAQPFADGAMPEPGTCRSVCLGQINLGSGGKGKTSRGMTDLDLVGLDLQSTKNCISEVALHMSRSRTMCTKWNSLPPDSNWIKATFSAYGSGVSCQLYKQKTVNGVKHNAYHVKENGELKEVWGPVPPDNAISKKPLEEYWPIKRSKLYEKYISRYKKGMLTLSDEDKHLLQESRIQSVLMSLRSSQQPIFFMIPVFPKTKPVLDARVAVSD